MTATLVAADQMLDGGPSVLYDAVALLLAEEAMPDLLQESAARDFVADAFAHCKFIGYVEAAKPLFEKAGIADSLDEGVVALSGAKDVASLHRRPRRAARLGPRTRSEDVSEISRLGARAQRRRRARMRSGSQCRQWDFEQGRGMLENRAAHMQDLAAASDAAAFNVAAFNAMSSECGRPTAAVRL